MVNKLWYESYFILELRHDSGEESKELQKERCKEENVNSYPYCYSTHPFARKEWYEVKSPAMFERRTCGLTPVTRTTGQSIDLIKIK